MRAQFSKVIAHIGMGALAACGTQIGAEDDESDCEIVTSNVLSDTSAAPDGFDESVDGALARLTGTFTGTITSHGEEVEYGSATAPPNALTLGALVTLTVTRAGDDVVLDEYESDEGEVTCVNRWSVPVTVGLVVDGELDELSSGTLVVTPDNEAGIYDLFVPLAELQGPTAPGAAIAASPEARLDIQAHESNGGWAGQLAFQSDIRPTDENGVDPDTFEQELLGWYEVN